MFQYFLLYLFIVCQCRDENAQILKTVDNIPATSSQNVHRDPYFPEVEYPKTVAEAHKPFFYKETDTYFDPFAPEVENNFKIITGKVSDKNKKKIYFKNNTRKHDSNLLLDVEHKLNDDMFIEETDLNLNTESDKTTIFTYPSKTNRFNETCNVNENNSYTSETYQIGEVNNDTTQIAFPYLAYFEINNQTNNNSILDRTIIDTENHNTEDTFNSLVSGEATNYINNTQNETTIESVSDVSQDDYIALIDVITDLIGVVNDTVTKMIGDVNRGAEEST